MSKRKRDPPEATKFGYSKLDVINKLLIPKIEGQFIADEGVKIFVQNIYATAPQSLNWNPIPELYDNERYYFVKRIPVSGKVKDPKNANRTVGSEDGYWKKSNCKEIINDEGTIVGWDSLLNFKEYTDRKRNTHFLMHEFSLDKAKFQEWVVCKVQYKVGKSNAVLQRQPMIPLAPLPEAIQENDQLIEDDESIPGLLYSQPEELFESVLDGPLYPQLENYESIIVSTTATPMNINEYEEDQQQEASVVSHHDRWKVQLPLPEANQCEFLPYDEYSEFSEYFIESVVGSTIYPQLEDYESIGATNTITTIDEYEASVVSQREDQIMVPYPQSQANQLGEAYNLNSGPLISQYQPQHGESIASNMMSIEEHQQEEEASADSGFRLSPRATIPMPQHLSLEESQTSLHEDWIDSYLICCQLEDQKPPEFFC